MRIAFVFPGQGSHRPGALSSWSQHPAIAVLDDLQAGAGGRDLLALSDDATAGSRTADAQPAIMAASVVAWRALTDAGVEPDVVAGHSLGEATAAVASGALTVRDGAAFVTARGSAMGEACAANPGTLAAIVKLDPDTVAAIVDGIPDLVIANDNAPGQVVVAGPPSVVAAVKDPVRDAGGRFMPLEVEGAFHSPAMEPAVAGAAAALEGLVIQDPKVPLVSGTTAEPLDGGLDVVQALVAGILSPVRWREVQLRLAELGVTDLVEVGPGGVLTGLAKRTVPDLVRHTVAGPDDLPGVVDALAARASS